MVKRGYRLPTYTQVANELIDSDMLDMNEAELKIHLVLFRQTLGWHRSGPVPLSVPDFMGLTGIQSETTIRAALKSGKERGTIIEAPERGPRGVKLYTLSYIEIDEEPAGEADPPEGDQKLTPSKNEGVAEDQNLEGSDPSTPPKNEGVQGGSLKKGLKEKDSSAGGAGEQPTPSDPPATTRTRKPKERKCPGPYQDNLLAVSKAITGTDTASTRFGAIASWLSGADQEIDGETYAGLSPFATPEEIALFPEWYEDLYDGEATLTRKLDLWMEYYPQFRADTRWHRQHKRRAANKARAEAAKLHGVEAEIEAGFAAFQQVVRAQQEHLT